MFLTALLAYCGWRVQRRWRLKHPAGVVRRTAEVQRLRRQAGELAAAAAARISQAAARLVARGLSVRDVAAQLGISRSGFPSSLPGQLTVRGGRHGWRCPAKQHFSLIGDFYLLDRMAADLLN
jgi:hypothetical protein